MSGSPVIRRGPVQVASPFYISLRLLLLFRVFAGHFFLIHLKSLSDIKVEQCFES